jgi:hypothetical protein
MDIRVTFYDDAATVLRIAGEFLASEPARHNIILSLLHGRITHREPGRYWVAAQNSRAYAHAAERCRGHGRGHCGRRNNSARRKRRGGNRRGFRGDVDGTM